MYFLEKSEFVGDWSIFPFWGRKWFGFASELCRGYLGEKVDDYTL
jgi:hypothetical protein